MSIFYIPEDNIERLDKQLASLQKKCKSYGFKFIYNKIGEEFKTFKTDANEEITIKYIVVEVEGQIKHEGWEFVATIDHSNKAGNIIRAFNTELVVPDRYKTCGPTCEHCNKIRSRKDTYLIYNHETQEFKQVGKSCMYEYTNGLDAEHVAGLVEWYTKLDEMSWGIPSGNYTKYHDVEEVLNYAFECYKHFGYEKAFDAEYEPPRRTTSQRVSDYMWYDMGRLTGPTKTAIEDEMLEVGFNHESEYAKQMTKDSLKWIAEQKDDNDYIRNLRIVCSEPYTQSRNFGILVSMPAAYGRYLDHKAYEEKKAEQHKIDLTSEFQGNVNDKLEIEVDSCKCVTTIDSIYGTSWLYRFTDKANNVYTWFASNPIQDEEIVTKIRGTVKKHEEYRGVKQTVLTRCKVIEVKEEQATAPESPQENLFDVIDEVFYQ